MDNNKLFEAYLKSDYVLSAETARGFPSTGGLDDDGSYYEDDSEYAYDQSEAKLFALTKDLGKSYNDTNNSIILGQGSWIATSLFVHSGAV